jgi:hypothetical protein
MVLPVTLNRLAPAIRALAIALAIASSAPAAIWVSPTGDDANPGTEELPIRTIERARDVVRTLNHDMADDITVFIAGEHSIAKAIEFGPEDSGSNGFNIVYTAAPGEHPVLNGAVRITGWTVADKAHNLWSAPSPAGLAATQGLFVNGRAASRTCSRLLAVFAKESVEPATTPDPKAQWKNPDDVIFGPVVSPAIWSERTATSPAFVENAFELLGVPGEWYHDRPAHRIYYTPRAGEAMATADIEAAVAQAFVLGTGSKDRPITGLVFKGIRFEYTACPKAQGDDRARSPLGAIHFEDAAGVQFLEDEFLHMSTPALDLGPGIEGGTVEGCLFGDISWSAVRIAGASAIRVSQSRFSYSAIDHIKEGAIDVDHSDDVVIEHDQFDHFPTSAVLVTDTKPGAVRRASNWLSPPMISLSGFAPHGAAPIPAQEIGISQDYRALEDEQFSSTTVPSPPTSVSAEAEDEFAYVTWIPSCRDGGAPVDSYSVESSTGAKATVSASAFQQKGYVVMNDLANGHPVSFTVSAINAVGTSPASLPTANVTPRQKRKLHSPGAPAALAVTPGAAGSTMRITPPAGDGGSPVVSYLIASGPTAVPIAVEGLDVIRADGSHPVVRTLPGFIPASGSTVSVVAVNTAGEGKPAVMTLK